MNRIGLFFGVLLILVQNLVFWQALLPEKMQQKAVCVEILTVLEHSNLKQHNLQMLDHDVKTAHHSDQMMDCHFCQLFHHLAVFSNASPKLLLIRQMIQLTVLRIAASLLFYLQRLFLSPQGRGPPTIFIFA